MQSLPLDVLRIVLSYSDIYERHIVRNVCRLWKKEVGENLGKCIRLNLIAVMGDQSPQLIKWAIDQGYPVNYNSMEGACMCGNLPVLEELYKKKKDWTHAYNFYYYAVNHCLDQEKTLAVAK